MKNEFSFSTFLISLIGVSLVLVISFSDQSQSKAQSFIHNYDNDLNNGQVKASSTETTITYTEINPKEVLDLLNNGETSTTIVDVSTGFKSGHIPKSINIPLKDIDKLAFGMDKNKTYIIYCRNNTDSLVAIQKLVGYGFQRLYRLSGGYNSWIGSKYKTER